MQNKLNPKTYKKRWFARPKWVKGESAWTDYIFQFWPVRLGFSLAGVAWFIIIKVYDLWPM
jgi:hypothetical protein